ncbi:glycosyltransferase [Paenarthrobacter sp. NPDC057355]|uniref:glycosyltransferase n=1 Tax=Paenarthrobacter sp. NPDC057355 TaxID=3346105 RepID=UPI00362D3AD0
MRILQVVTLLTPDNAYGGPLRVAVNQVRELRAQGHEVDLVAGVSGFPRTPETVDGVEIRLFPVANLVPGTGFAGLFSWRMLCHLIVNMGTYDVVHVHLARDLVTLPAAALALLWRRAYVLQTHGMIDASDRRLAKVLDFFITRAVVGRAKAVLYLTELEKDSLASLFALSSTTLVPLPNGVPLPQCRGTKSGVLDVLYLARLQARKRPMEFLRAAKEIGPGMSETTTRFSLVGPDEGEGNSVKAFIAALPKSPPVVLEGPLGPDETLTRMESAAIYVLPSVDEPFPMSVLEAMSVGLPVVITKSNGLAPFVERHAAGIVIDVNEGALAAPLKMLMQDAELRERMGENARRAASEHFSIAAVTKRLYSTYMDVGESTRGIRRSRIGTDS